MQATVAAAERSAYAVPQARAPHPRTPEAPRPAPLRPQRPAIAPREDARPLSVSLTHVQQRGAGRPADHGPVDGVS